MITHFEVGVKLRRATLPNGISGLASGKYAAAQSAGMTYGTTTKP